MATIKIIDNWLEPDLAEYLSEYLDKGLLYSTSHGSLHMDNTSFLNAELPFSPMSQFLVYKLNKIKKVTILRAYVNLHYQCHGGGFHTDEGKLTFVYMVSKSVKGGSFEMKGEEKVDYKFNRLIYFPANRLHKGHAPSNNVKRLTLAFKTV